MTLQDKILTLNRLDLQVRQLRSSLDANLRRHEASSKKLEQLQQQHTELDEQRKQITAKSQILEKHVVETDEKIDKLRDQMNTITNNKQYQAMLVEINTMKREKTEVEEAAIKFLAAIDELNKRIEVKAKEVEDQQKIVDVAAKDVDASKAEIAEQLSVAEQERDEAAAELPDRIRATYQRLSDQYEGEAVSIVKEIDRKRMEYISSASHMQLPLDIVNTLITRPDELVLCPTSHVILIMDPEKRTEMIEAASK